MAIPTLNDLMGTEVSDSINYDPLPNGNYNGVITKVEVRNGAKAVYLNVEVTIHDEEYKGRKIWGISSFSEKALAMPGGIANVLQTVKPQIDMSTPQAEIPAVMAAAITSYPVTIRNQNEQVKRNGELAIKDDGSPEMRSKIAEYLVPSDEFKESVELDAQGLDDDLPW